MKNSALSIAKILSKCLVLCCILNTDLTFGQSLNNQIGANISLGQSKNSYLVTGSETNKNIAPLIAKFNLSNSYNDSDVYKIFRPENIFDPAIPPVRDNSIKNFCGYMLKNDFDPKETNYHSYSLAAVICKTSEPYCTLSNVFNFMLSDANYLAPSTKKAFLYPENVTFFSEYNKNPDSHDLMRMPNYDLYKISHIAELVDAKDILDQRNNGDKVCNCKKTMLFGFGDNSNGTRALAETIIKESLKFTRAGLISIVTDRGGVIYGSNENPIVTNVYEDRYTIINRALPGHTFYPGNVIRKVVEKNGVIMILTEGIGTTAKSETNEVGGTVLFNRIDNNLWIDFNIISHSKDLQKQVKDKICEEKETAGLILEKSYTIIDNQKSLLQDAPSFQDWHGIYNSISALLVNDRGILINPSDRPKNISVVDLGIALNTNSISSTFQKEVETGDVYSYESRDKAEAFYTFSSQTGIPRFLIDARLSIKDDLTWTSVPGTGTLKIVKGFKRIDIDNAIHSGRLIIFDNVLLRANKDGTGSQRNEENLPDHVISGRLFVWDMN